MMRYVLEPTVDNEWMVVIPAAPPAPNNIVHSGRAQECIDWCLAQGARRLGPRVFELAR